MEQPITHEWCVRTGGVLTSAQRRALLTRSLRTYADHAQDLARLAAGRRNAAPVRLPSAPDSGIVETALEAARDQGSDLEGHGLRTWLLGGALADRDGVELDPELFAVAAIVHDAGGAKTVAGQDFTIRSAAIAMEALDRQEERAGDVSFDEDRRRELRDGIVAHATAGITAEQNALATYVQAGALLDLVGMRLVDLPRATVADVFARHPAGTVRDTIRRLIDDEARAVPGGRWAQLRRLGLGVAVVASPMRSYHRT